MNKEIPQSVIREMQKCRRALGLPQWPWPIKKGGE